jgi:aryl-alcohol dehydrogenase-like predicted oxidoreductase
MRRRRFGRDGSVSAIGLGCMSFGGFYGPTTEAETMRALARARLAGFDNSLAGTGRRATTATG